MKRSREHPREKFSALMHHFTEENLEACFHELDSKKAVGIDGIGKEEYGANLEGNLGALVSRLKRFSYRPQPVRRAMIPKGGGKFRPLGVSCLEDKLVQGMAAKILNAIYEPGFMSCSYGFRPGGSCHDAIRSTYQYLYKERVRWVVDLDIEAYFDTIDQEWLMRCLEERIRDWKFLRLILRMLKAGVMSKGEFSVSLEGIAFFDNHRDAHQFIEAAQERFEKFGLRIHAKKTRIIQFNHGSKDPGSFDFLGFTFYRGKSRKGHRVVKCRTSVKRMRAKVKLFQAWIKAHRNRHRLSNLWPCALTKLSGHYPYYGLTYNRRQLWLYYWQVTGLLFKWLNRRSQRRSFTWEQFSHRLRLFPLPRPCLHHRLY